jgi:YihY family inner membrane protein
MSRLGDAYRAFDRFQQRHAWLGFALAVRQKYSDDQGGYLAATVAWYAFFSLFPLLLVLTTILGFVLHGDASLQQRIVGTALAQIPVLGSDLRARSLTGNGLALAVGIAAALWAGMGVFLASENAMNHLWGVPFRRRPDALRQRLRALLLLLVLGVATLATTALGAFGTVGSHYALAWKLGSIAASTLLNFGVFWFAMKKLTAKEIGWRDVRGGAIGAAILYEGLQVLGGVYIDHVRNATATYGVFAIVIGLLSYIYLGAHVILLAAEANVVAHRRLWPRSFSVIVEEPATDADERALTQRARVEERRSDERVAVEFDDEEKDGAA